MISRSDKAFIDSWTGEVTSYLLGGNKIYVKHDALMHLRQCGFSWSEARSYLALLEADVKN